MTVLENLYCHCFEIFFSYCTKEYEEMQVACKSKNGSLFCINVLECMTMILESTVDVLLK